MLNQDIVRAAKQRDSRVEFVSSSNVDLLVSGIEIALEKKHGGASELVVRKVLFPFIRSAVSRTYGPPA